MSDKTRRTRAVERLADALQECLDAAVETGTASAESRMNERMGRQDETLRALNTRMSQQDETLRALNTRMSQQDGTLRMIWSQAKGKGSLPIDP